MWLSFELLESGLQMDMASIILILLSVFIFIFSAKSPILSLFFGIFIYPLLALWFYNMQWTYQTPMALTLICLILMALTINSKASGETII